MYHSILLEISPNPTLELNEGESIVVSCGPLAPTDPLQVMLNGVQIDFPFTDDAGMRVFQLGAADRRNDSTIVQCVSGAVLSANTTLIVFCESLAS